jgi:hypothetical protein
MYLSRGLGASTSPADLSCPGCLKGHRSYILRGQALRTGRTFWTVRCGSKTWMFWRYRRALAKWWKLEGISCT